MCRSWSEHVICLFSVNDSMIATICKINEYILSGSVHNCNVLTNVLVIDSNAPTNICDI